jgi:hypothetical protein
MIGRVTWRRDVYRTIATLEDDRTWTVDGPPGLARSIAALYTDWPDSPALGPYGPAILHDLARRVGGTVELEPKDAPPAGTVY